MSTSMRRGSPGGEHGSITRAEVGEHGRGDIHDTAAVELEQVGVAVLLVVGARTMV